MYNLQNVYTILTKNFIQQSQIIGISICRIYRTVTTFYDKRVIKNIYVSCFIFYLFPM